MSENVFYGYVVIDYNLLRIINHLVSDVPNPIAALAGLYLCCTVLPPAGPAVGPEVTSHQPPHQRGRAGWALPPPPTVMLALCLLAESDAYQLAGWQHFRRC